jgi:hypothetical protein
MTDSNAFQCRHESTAPKDVMESLPDGQAGVGRHKCAACAFEAGVKHGRELERRERNG